jgi:hypothetical protein
VATINTPFIIDIEASGFGSSSYPIEVGAVLTDGQKFCTLIYPEADWTHWDDEAEQIHHISRNALMTYGRRVKDVANTLNEVFEGATLYSDGWVVDKPWLTTLFHAARLPMKFKVSPLELILTEQQMAIWHETKDRVTIEMNMARHRASNDAAIIQATYDETLKVIMTKNNH